MCSRFHFAIYFLPQTCSTLGRELLVIPVESGQEDMSKEETLDVAPGVSLADARGDSSKSKGQLARLPRAGMEETGD